MRYNAKNYTEQGGEKTVIGGTLEIKEGASVTGLLSLSSGACHRNDPRWCQGSREPSGQHGHRGHRSGD